MAKPAANKRRAAETRGRRAETAAAMWLRLKGYRVVDMRARTPVGEIDIVATRGHTLAFIEVKQRKTDTAALNAVSAYNWQRISAAAEAWAARRPAYRDMDWRYDLIAILPWQRPRHYKDFWRP